jgi:hypothetical protein
MILLQPNTSQQIYIFKDLFVGCPDPILVRFEQRDTQTDKQLELSFDHLTYQSVSLFVFTLTNVKSEEDLANGIIYLPVGEHTMSIYTTYYDEVLLYQEITYLPDEL